MKVQQWHKSAQALKQSVKAWQKDPSSSWSKDYGNYEVYDVKRGYGWNPVGDRNLYNIYLRKKRRK